MTTLQPPWTSSRAPEPGSTVEQELRQALAVHKATLDAAAEGIVVTNEHGRVTAVNQRFLDMWRLPDALRASDDFSAWVAWGASLCVEPAVGSGNYQAAVVSDTVHAVVIHLKDGRVFERHSQPQIIDGRIAGRVWCYRDLSEWVRAEEERRRFEAQVQHAQKLESLGVLAGGIAHDFNNLLVGILGNAGMALMDLPPDSAVITRLEEIQTAAQRAAELANQMLAYSGKGRFVLRSCDLSEIAGEMTKLLHTAIDGAELELHLAPDVPAVQGDPAQMRQVIMNLITNAADASDNRRGPIVLTTGEVVIGPGELAAAAESSDLAPGRCAFVEVRDAGVGMTPETVARIFDPFFTTKFTGRGLGLAAVLGIVRRHHGAIIIDTAPGRGTSFRVLFPVSEYLPPPAAVAVPPPVPARGARILVVDDETPVLRVVGEMLTRAGFEVRAAAGGEEALRIAAEPGATPDAVLLDMTMPRMNGAETFKQIKARWPDLPVVLMSGYSSEEAVSRFGLDGLAGFLQKPFMPAALVRTLSAVVRPRSGRA